MQIKNNFNLYIQVKKNPPFIILEIEYNFA